jgi:DNA primase
LVIADLAHLVWAVNIGCLGFHSWAMRASDDAFCDELRIDLDPGPGTTFPMAQETAAHTKELMDELGVRAYIKTTGNRGLHVYVRLQHRWDSIAVRSAAVAVARELERRRPTLITASWWKEERGARIFIDFNQNARDRTIASAYSIRPKPGATVSAPLDWDELPHIAPEDFTVATMPARFSEKGDVHAAIDDAAYSLQPLLDLYESDLADGLTDMPYPPDYPKMPGEPKRVQPSRDRDRPRD